MFDTLDNAFNDTMDVFEPCAAFAALALSFGWAKILIEGEDVPVPHEVEEHLGQHGIKADAYQVSSTRLVVAIAGADEQRARALLENFYGGGE